VSSVRAAGRAVTAACLTIILAGLFYDNALPRLVPIGLMAFAAVTMWRPEIALLLVAALTPIATSIGRSWDAQVAWAETIVVSFAAGWFWRGFLVRQPVPQLPLGLRRPVILFALVIAAAVFVQASVEQVRFGTVELSSILWRLVSRDYFVSGSDQYLHAASFLLEGLLLLSAAAHLVAQDSRFLRHLGMALAAAGALAAAMNLNALVTSAWRSDHFWGLLAQHVRTTRINVHYGDVNAAGSHFVMLAFVAAALGLAGRGLARSWFAATALLLLGVWLSGSRAALFAGPLALAIAVVGSAQARADRRTRILVGIAGAGLVAAAIGLLTYAPMRGNQKSSSVAAEVRVEMARTSMRMLATNPAFGIGPGQFYQRSGEFSSPELLQVFPRAAHENAHNNFLQVLAEMGIAGFAVFAWLLAAGARGGWRHLQKHRADIIAWGALGGVMAFLLTWLAGHPLLTREPAYAFWLLLGAVAGAGAESPRVESVDRTAATRRGNVVLAVAAVLLLISVPFRASSAQAQADLDHLGIGLSPHWETSDDGVRYRSAAGGASLFVPGDSGFRFKVRTISKLPEHLELRLAGRLADVVTVEPNQWTEVAMPARSDRPDARFLKMDLRAVDPRAEPVTIWVSKVEAVGH
jgi:O-antigen ligase